MLRPLVDDLRVRTPLERSSTEMADLLMSASESWPAGHQLFVRPGGYTRTRAYRDQRFEVLLHNWEAGAISRLHDHGDQHCWMAVLDGQLQVDDYARLDAGSVPGFARVEPTGSRVLGPGDLDLRSGRFDLHRVGAVCNVPAVSLHVYAGPLLSYSIYDELTQRCETVAGTYDDVLSIYATAARA